MLKIAGGVLLILAGAVLCLIGTGLVVETDAGRGANKAMMAFGVFAVFGGIGLIWKARDDKSLKRMDEKSEEMFVRLMRMKLAGKSDRETVDHWVKRGEDRDSVDVWLGTANFVIKRYPDTNFAELLAGLDEMLAAGKTKQEMVDHAVQYGVPAEDSEMLAKGLLDCKKP